MRIADASVQQVKTQADILQVVGAYTTVKRSGSTHKAICPFHNEKTPSLSIDPRQQVFHCFGCGVGGDAISFIQRIEGLDFPETIERLAGLFNITLRYEGGKPADTNRLGQRTRLADVTALAAEFFHDQLTGDTEIAKTVRAYLHGRHITDEAIETFNLGWAPDSWDSLSRHLIHHNDITVDDATAAGVIGHGRNGPIDRFRGRVIFPILDSTGRRTIAFGGRRVDDIPIHTWSHDNPPPKYINSPDGPLYSKSAALYGLSHARRHITSTGTALVVEGYTDVIALHLAGHGNAVATCGTALTAEHLRSLARQADRIGLALDGDTAGLDAAERARKTAADIDGPPIVVMPLPSGTDPAELAAEGPQRVQQAIDSMVTATEFAIRYTLAKADLSTPDSRTAAMRNTIPLLADLDDRILRYTYIRDVLSPAVRIPSHIIEAEVDGAAAPRRRARLTTAPHTPDAIEPGLSAQAQLERLVLQTALKYPNSLPERWAQIRVDEFTSNASKILWTAILRAEDDNPTDPQERLAAVLDKLPDDTWRNRVRALSIAECSIPEEPDKLHAAYHRLRETAVERKIAHYREQVANSADRAEQIELLTAITALRKQPIRV